MVGRRVLIVEDSAAVRAILARAVTALPDVTCDEAVDGVDALRKLRRRSYDVIFVDLNMPRIGGLKLIEQVRRSKRRFDVRIVVVTTQAADADRDKAMALGADVFLAKPIRQPELAACLERLLRA